MGRDLGGSDELDSRPVSSPFFWWGVGPGNFGGPYLKYKLPESSEEILDPHNLFLEVWATAGFWALLALWRRAGMGPLGNLWPSRLVEESEGPSSTDRRRRRDSGRDATVDQLERTDEHRELDDRASRTAWLVGLMGVGGWALVVVLGQLNPFEAKCSSAG